MTNDEIKQCGAHDREAGIEQLNSLAASNQDAPVVETEQTNRSATSNQDDENAQGTMTETSQADLTILDDGLKPRVSPGANVPPKMPSLAKKYPFYGILGDLLRAIMPHVEADEMALAAPFLAGIGNLIGAGPHFKAGNVDHHLSLYAALFSTSPDARKSTAIRIVVALLRKIDRYWAARCQEDALLSGSFVISRVGDQDQSDDRAGLGITEKRLFIVDEGFPETLTRIRQPGDSISPALCALWHPGSAKNVADEVPFEGPSGLVSVVGDFNATKGLRKLIREQQRPLDRRFLWFFVERSKCVPGYRIPANTLEPFVPRLKKIVTFARTVGEMRRSIKAEKLWAKLHARMPEKHPERPAAAEGLKALAREHVMRMACLFALLDMKSTIKVQHLKAAAAMWDHASASIDFIFGGQNR